MTEITNKLTALAADPYDPDVDPQMCGWSSRTELTLLERFIADMGLNGLYDKFLRQIAAEELAGLDGDDDEEGDEDE